MYLSKSTPFWGCDETVDGSLYESPKKVKGKNKRLIKTNVL